MSRTPLLPETREGSSRLGDGGLELRVGVQPRLNNELVVMKRRWPIPQPLGEACTLEHQWNAAIVGPIKQRSGLPSPPDRRKQTKSHITKLLGVGTHGVGESQKAIERGDRVSSGER